MCLVCFEFGLRFRYAGYDGGRCGHTPSGASEGSGDGLHYKVACSVNSLKLNINSSNFLAPNLNGHCPSR